MDPTTDETEHDSSDVYCTQCTQDTQDTQHTQDTPQSLHDNPIMQKILAYDDCPPGCF